MTKLNYLLHSERVSCFYLSKSAANPDIWLGVGLLLPMSIFPKICFAIAACFAICVGAGLVASHNLEVSTVWTPASAQLDFGHSSTVIKTFVVNKTCDYTLDIYLQNKLPSAQIESIIAGLTPGSPVDGLKAVKVPRISCSVKRDGKEVLDHRYYGQGGWSRDYCDTMLGGFSGIKGKSYTLTVKIEDPEPAISVIRPRLDVELAPRIWHAYQYKQLGYGLEIISASILTLIFVFLGVGNVVLQKARQRTTAAVWIKR